MLIRLAAFAFGFETLLAQTILLREMFAAGGGNELMLGAFYALWFFGIFMGAMAKSKRREISPARTRGAAAGMLALQALWLPIAIAIMRCWKSWTGLGVGEMLSIESMAACLFAAIFPFSCMTGYLFPALCEMEESPALSYELAVNPRNANGNTNALGLIYGFESLGGLAGGLLFSAVLVEYFGSFRISIYLAGIVLLLCGALSKTQFQYVICNMRIAPFHYIKHHAHIVYYICGIVIVTNSFWLFGRKLQSLDDYLKAHRWASAAGSMERLAGASSRFQEIEIGRHEGQYSVLTNGQFAFSFPDPYSAQSLAHSMMAQTSGHGKVLLLGGGLSGLIPELLKYQDVQVDCAEMDSKIMDMALPYLRNADSESAGVLLSPRVTFYAKDGFELIRSKAAEAAKHPVEKCALIASFAPDPLNASQNRYYTKEFFEYAKAIMHEDGVFSMRLSAGVNYFGPEIKEFTGGVYSALRQVFPHVIASPGDEIRFYASCSAGILSSDPSILAKRYRAFGIKSEHFSEDYFSTLFEPGQTLWTHEALEIAAQGAIANSNSRPVSYVSGLRLWKFFSGSEASSSFNGVAKAMPLAALAPAIFFLFMAVSRYVLARRDSIVEERKRILSKKKVKSRVPDNSFPGLKVSSEKPPSGNFIFSPKHIALCSIYLMGATGLAVSLLLFFSFQTLLGFLYRECGILSGLFMAGLALGGFTFRKEPRGRQSLGKAIMAMGSLEICAAVVFGIMAIVLKCLFDSEALSRFSRNEIQVIIYALMGASGMITGAAFPLAGRILDAAGAGSGCAVANAAARVNAADHLGAMTGALLTTLVLLPRFGLAALLGGVAALHIMEAVILLIYKRNIARGL